MRRQRDGRVRPATIVHRRRVLRNGKGRHPQARRARGAARRRDRTDEPDRLAACLVCHAFESHFSPFSDQLIISIQTPLRLDDLSEPEPDVVLLRLDAPQDRHPGPREALLVIEVADSSIRVDRGRKLPLYARAGIAEYWIVDLNADRIEVYRDPMRSRYRSTALLGRGDTVSPLFAPDIVVDVNSVLGQVRAEQ